MSKIGYGSALLIAFALMAIVTVSGLQANDAVAQQAPLVRIYYDDVGDLSALYQFNIDLHEYNNLADRFVIAAASQGEIDRLTAAGWTVAAIEAVDRPQPATPDTAETYYGGYRTVDEIYALLASTNAAYPDLTELVDYGDGYCKGIGGCNIDGFTNNGNEYDGHDLLAIRVGNEANARSAAGVAGRPVFVLIGAVHARELTTAEQALFMLDYLTTEYASNADVRWLVDWHDIYIVPVANPEGRYVVEAIPDGNGDPSSQRKNANNDEGNCFIRWGSTFGQPGIDLNRNFSFGFGTGGASTSQCSLVFQGDSAASQPEVSALQTWLTTLFPDQRGPNISDAAPLDATGIMITMHAYSDLVLWPWGYTTNPAPNIDGLRTIGDKLGALTGYTSCQPSECLYEASGTTDDWSYGELGIASFTFEIGSSSDGFFPAYETVQSQHWGEVRDALLYAARIARAPYMLADGPDVEALTVTPAQNGGVNIAATIDDSQNGGQAIAAAEAYIDLPYWEPDAIPIALDLDARSAVATGAIDSCALNLDAGTHTLFVRGRDAGDSWGPLWATEFSVDCAVPTAVTALPIESRSGISTVLLLLGAILTTATLFVRRRG